MVCSVWGRYDKKYFSDYCKVSQWEKLFNGKTSEVVKQIT